MGLLIAAYYINNTAMMKLDRRSILFGMGAAMVATSPLAAKPRAKQSISRISGVARKILAENAAPALQIAVGDHGSLTFNRAFGSANLETRSLAHTTSIFRIGSLTKQFTAAAILKLAEQGRLDLDAPVSNLLPAFVGKSAFSLREAMHQTAGLHSDEAGGALPDDGTLTQVQIASSIASQDKLFDFAPGTAWLYSNANYIVLGAAIEVVTGQRFDRAMDDLVLVPLGLRSTAVDRASNVVAGRANGYSYDDKPTPPRWNNAQAIDVWQAGGAGAMRSTAADLARWHQLLLSGKVVNTEALLEAGRLRDGRLSGANRFSSDDANYGDVQYAAGLLVSPAGKGPRTVQHYGFISGFSALLETELDRMRTLAVLQNSDPWPKLHFRELRKAAFG